MAKKVKCNNLFLVLLILVPLLLLSLTYYYKKYENFINQSNFEVKYNPLTNNLVNVPLSPINQENIENFENKGFYVLKYNPLTKKEKKISLAPVRDSKNIEPFFNFTKPKLLPPEPPSSDLKSENIFTNNKVDDSANNMKLGSKVKTPVIDSSKPIDEKAIIDNGGVKPLNMTVQKAQSQPPLNMNNIFNNMTCGFYETCPADYKNMGNLGISGNNVSLSCNGNTNKVIAKAYGIIKNGSVEKIAILDEGKGYEPNSKPKITIEGNGGGAMAEAVVDDNGNLKVIHVIQGGSGYTESPEIAIEQPNSTHGCNFCCKLNK